MFTYFGMRSFFLRHNWLKKVRTAIKYFIFSVLVFTVVVGLTGDNSYEVLIIKSIRCTNFSNLFLE